MPKPELSPYHVLLMKQESVARILHELEKLILATPSGAVRNQLCDTNIAMTQYQEDLAKERRTYP